MEDARRELREKVGLRPSDHWMTDCWQALSQPQQQRRRRRQHPRADDVLEQVLHHDLRDVVRTFAGDNTNQTANSNNTSNSRTLAAEILPSAQLRQAIHQSQQGGTHGFRAVLPSSFTLMVQVEEVLDVSANAMSRLENGTPASNNNAGNPPPPPPSPKRCLKIAYTDGYNPPSGDAVYRDDNPTPHESLVAVEIQVIPDLSVASPAGLKVFLHGPLEIRRGVAFWHPGNATVLGGQVAALVVRQRQALEAAQRAAGVGVDPTVRALIGTTPSTPDEDNDEGEHESGDVVATSTPPLAPPPATVPLPPSYVPPTTTTTRPINATTTTTTIPYTGNPYHSQRIASQPTAGTPPPPLAPVGNPYDRTELRSTPPATATNVRQASSSATANSRNSHGSRSISSSSSHAGSETTTRTHTSRSPVNPYARTSTVATIQRKPTVPPSTTTPVSCVVPPDKQVILIDEDNDTPIKEDVVVMEDSVVTKKQDDDSPTITAYHELYNTLKRLVEAGPDAFGRARRQEWLVELKQMVSTRVDFNVISHKQPGSKRKVYEYWLLYKFGVPENCDQLVTCLLDTTIVEECFGQSPADLRQLRKTQSPEAQRISKEGGQRIATRIEKLRLYRVTLINNVLETFWKEASRPLDGKQPILHLHAN